MTKLEKQCETMADVCELAHKRTVRECRKLKIKVDCISSMLCGDNDNHREDNEVGDHYTLEAQEIFDKHYDKICNATGL